MRGKNPLDQICVMMQGTPVVMSEIYPTYDWVAGDGKRNMSRWIHQMLTEETTETFV